MKATVAHAVIGRHFATAWLDGWKWTLDAERIASVQPIDEPETIGESDDWLAPAFWDLQINGRWGISFSDPGLTVEQVAEIVRAQAELGTARLCPTLITGAPGRHASRRPDDRRGL